MPQKIGEFMVSIGAMTKSHIEIILEIQRGGDKRRFGDIAFDLGYLTDGALKRYVDYAEIHTDEIGGRQAR